MELYDTHWCANQDHDTGRKLLITISEDAVCSYSLVNHKWYPTLPGIPGFGPFADEQAEGLSTAEMLERTGLSVHRYEHIVSLMKQTGVRHASLHDVWWPSRSETPEVSLLVYGEGLGPSGYSVYYIYRDEVSIEENFVEDLWAPASHERRYVALEGNWYLERLDS